MVKIAFHDNCLCERGTTVSLYDYAYYNKYYLGNESIIMYIGNDGRNVPEVIDKFKKEFTLRPYINWQKEADNILKEEKCDILYMQKAGEWDGKIASPSICKSIIHCVFNTQYNHGDVYGRISHCFGRNYPVVNYMINLPNVDTNMRNELNIPNDAIVFGRHGGACQFNIGYVHKVINKVTNEYPNVFFLMVNTNKFCEDNKNIIHYEKIIELNKKVEFINTCDAMIHARQVFESDVMLGKDIDLFNDFLISIKDKDWDLIHLGMYDIGIFDIPIIKGTTGYRKDYNFNANLIEYIKNNKDTNGKYIEDITGLNDKYRLIRKFHTRCTDSFLWKYNAIVKYLNWLNNIETNYGVPMDYYMCNFFENNIDFKHYWSINEFFKQGSNLGIIKSTLQCK